MDPSSLLRPDEPLHARVTEAMRRHLISPNPSQPAGPLTPARIEEFSRRALDTMLTRQYRVGPLPEAKVYDTLLGRVRRFVRKGQPIKVTLGYGPLKNQHAVSYSRADWAEAFALYHLVAWHNKVQAVYPPGLQVQIVFDDTTLVRANHANRTLMASYMKSIADLIHALKFEAIFLEPFAQSCFSWAFHLTGLYPLSEVLVWFWERNPANRAQMDRMDEYARRNLVLPEGLSPPEEQRRIKAAAHRYRVYWEALQWSSIFWAGFKLIAMYLDGSQHHVRQAIALHLTTLDKGQITQPWQGEGALVENGCGKLEPFVLTAGRRTRHSTRIVEGLDLVPVPGFERIAVAAPLTEKVPESATCADLVSA
jgi:hypothetical protein